MKAKDRSTHRETHREDYVGIVPRRSRSSSLTLSALADLAEAVESSSSPRARSASSDGIVTQQRSRRGTLLSSAGGGGNGGGNANVRGAAAAAAGGASVLSAKKKRRKTAAGAKAVDADGASATGSKLTGVAVKAKQRLERNRDAAQAYRRRKKEQLVMLSARIKELEAENAALRERMDVGGGGGEGKLKNCDGAAAGPAVDTGGATAAVSRSVGTRVVGGQARRPARYLGSRSKRSIVLLDTSIMTHAKRRC